MTIHEQSAKLCRLIQLAINTKAPLTPAINQVFFEAAERVSMRSIQEQITTILMMGMSAEELEQYMLRCEREAKIQGEKYDA